MNSRANTTPTATPAAELSPDTARINLHESIVWFDYMAYLLGVGWDQWGEGQWGKDQWREGQWREDP